MALCRAVYSVGVAGAWLRAALAGEDGPGQPALPAGELLHPVPLAALAALVVNDWLIKPNALVPGWLSGKLSDVAGLLAAPLVATAAIDCTLWLLVRLSRRSLTIDFSLRRGRLLGAAACVAAAFAALKMCPAAAHALERAAGWLGGDWRVVSDPTDLVALPAVALAALLGRREIARVPLGRIEVLERRSRARGQPPGPELEDVVRCGADRARAEQLASALESYFQGGPPEPVRAALDRLRKRPG
jgi:hypothetical protein